MHTSYLLGVNMRTGQLQYSDDPDLQRGDIICDSGALRFDHRLEKVVGAHPYSWHKVKSLKKPGPRVEFMMTCPVCRKTFHGRTPKEHHEKMLRHFRGDHRD